MPDTGLATDVPQTIEETSDGPSISMEDKNKGIAEGNPYVVYSGVMCFGGTLQTPEEYKRENPSASDYDSFLAKYNATPEVVKAQSEENKKLQTSFIAPKECSDAGWKNAGPV